MNEKVKLEGKVRELEEERRQVTVKIAAMVKTPKYEPGYSQAKLDSWQREVEKLDVRLGEVWAQLREHVGSPEYTKRVEAQVTALKKERDALLGELEKVKGALTEKGYASTQLVLEGASPMKLAAELVELEERQKLLTRAVQLVQGCIKQVTV